METLQEVLPLGARCRAALRASCCVSGLRVRTDLALHAAAVPGTSPSRTTPLRPLPRSAQADERTRRRERCARAGESVSSRRRSSLRSTRGIGIRLATRAPSPSTLVISRLAWVYPLKSSSSCTLCGLVHDIGKIGLPAGLLEKPGALTLEERREMQQHSEIGERILANVDTYAEIAAVVRHHHERIDGEGYPDGLRGRCDPASLEDHCCCRCVQRHDIGSTVSRRDAESCRSLETGARRRESVRHKRGGGIRGDSRGATEDYRSGRALSLRSRAQDA